MVPASKVKGVGSVLAEALARHGLNSAEQIAKAKIDDLVAVPGVGEPRARLLIAAAVACVALIAKDGSQSSPLPRAKTKKNAGAGKKKAIASRRKKKKQPVKPKPEKVRKKSSEKRDGKKTSKKKAKAKANKKLKRVSKKLKRLNSDSKKKAEKK